MEKRNTLNLQELRSVRKWAPPVFEGGSEQDAQLWLHAIQHGCKARSIPEDLYHVVARRYLSEALKTCIAMYERSISKISPDFRWNWEAFETAVVAVTVDPSASVNTFENQENLPASKWGATKRLIREHPTATRTAGAILIAAGTAAVVPVAAVGVLGVLGFSSGGVVAGSIAAGIQSTFYGGAVGAGSLFALAQSAGATGVAVSAGTSIATGAATGASWFRWRASRRRGAHSSPPTEETMGDSPSPPHPTKRRVGTASGSSAP